MEKSDKNVFKPSDFENGITLNLKADVCVIGSGSAGGVASAYLASKGVQVIVLEEGPYVTPQEFNQREDEMIPLLYRDSANQMEEGFRISVLQGRCAGGSSVINMADCVMTPRPVYDFWVNVMGYTGPLYEELVKASEKVKARLGVQKIREEDLNENNKLLLDSARSLGYSGDTFENNRVGCIGCGYCLIGCHYNAKKSVLITFLEDALSHGARLYSRFKVERLTLSGKRVVQAEGVILDERSEEPRGRFSVEAKLFILAAGSVHSPLIIKKSGILEDGIGEHLSLQPQIPVMALFERDIVAFRGTPQAAFVDEFEEITEDGGYDGFRIEGVMAGPAMSAGFAPGTHHDLKRVMTYLRKTAAALILFSDRPSGRVTLKEDGRPKITYNFTYHLENKIKYAMKKAAEIYLHAGAKLIAFPTIEGVFIRKKEELREIDRLNFSGASLRLVSAHPQGTLRMASGGPVGPDFKLKGVDNVFVCDASIFPTTASSHIMVPVMSYAQVAAERVIRIL